MELVISNNDILDAIKTYVRKRVKVEANETLQVEIVRSLKPTAYSAKVTITPDAEEEVCRHIKAEEQLELSEVTVEQEEPEVSASESNAQTEAEDAPESLFNAS